MDRRNSAGHTMVYTSNLKFSDGTAIMNYFELRC